MWELLPRSSRLLLVVMATLMLGAFVQSLDALFQAPPLSTVRVASMVAFIIGTLLVGIFHLSWRAMWAKFPFLGKRLFPDLNGEWGGELISTWRGADGKQIPPIACQIWITQNLFTITIKQKTGESTSYSRREMLERDPHSGTYRVWYSYTNTPRAVVQHRSVRHDGVAWLEMDVNQDSKAIHGQYFTSRRTSGDIELRKHSDDPGSD